MTLIERIEQKIKSGVKVLDAIVAKTHGTAKYKNPCPNGYYAYEIKNNKITYLGHFWNNGAKRNPKYILISDYYSNLIRSIR